MWEQIQHEQYKGHDIRSSPREVEKGWKIRLNITFPQQNGVETIREYLDEAIFPVLDQAHKAGFEKGHRIVDTQGEPQHELAGGLPWLQHAEIAGVKRGGRRGVFLISLA